jgi:two-component system, response regulator YesN
MKRRSVLGQNRFYLYIFLSLTLAIVLSILVLSTVFYGKSEQILTTQIDTYIHNNLAQLSANVEQVTDSVRKTLVQIYFDKSISVLFYSSHPDYDIFMKSTEQLQNYRFITNDIKSVYLINKTTRTVFISAENSSSREQEMSAFFDQDIFRFIKDYKSDRSFLPVPRIIPNEDGSLESYPGYTMLFFDAVNPVASNSVVVANIDESLILDNVAKLDTAFDARTYIVDRSGMLVIDTPDAPMMTDLSDEPFVSKVLGSAPESGMFIIGMDGVETYVAYTAPDKNGWRILSAVPYSAITQQITSLGRQIILFALLILAAGTLLSLFLSRQLYSPIQKVLRNLESEKKDSHQTMKQEMLRNIVTGFSRMDAKLPVEKLSRFGIQKDPNASIRVTLFRIDGYSEFIGRYGIDDRASIKFAVMNIIQELMPPGRSVETVDMGDDRLVLLEFFPDPAAAETSAGFTEVVHKLQESIQQYLRLSVSVFFSPLGGSIEYVTFLYNLVLRNSFYRLFKGRGCVIPPEYADGLRNGDFRTGEGQSLDQMVHELMVGNYEAASAQYDLAIEGISHFSAGMANIAFSHLVFSVTTSIETIRKNNFPNVPVTFDLSITLNEFETIEEVNERFHSAFQALAQLMASRRNSQYDELLQRVRALVESEYMNSQLSLEYVADQLDLSPQYLSRLFKRFASGSIPELILQTRMSHAKELLGGTDLSVAQISERVGFTNDGYFYKVFKEYYGATPGDFRKKDRI